MQHATGPQPRQRPINPMSMSMHRLSSSTGERKQVLRDFLMLEVIRGELPRCRRTPHPPNELEAALPSLPGHKIPNRVPVDQLDHLLCQILARLDANADVLHAQQLGRSRR